MPVDANNIRGVDEAIGAFLNHLDVANEVQPDSPISQGITNELRALAIKYIRAHMPPSNAPQVGSTVRAKAWLRAGVFEIEEGEQGLVVLSDEETNQLHVKWRRRIRGLEVWDNVMYFDIRPGGAHGIDITGLEVVG